MSLGLALNMPPKKCSFIDDAADDEDGGASDEDEDDEEEDDLCGFIVADCAPETDEEEVEGAEERTQRERKPHRDLSEDDLDLILENAGMKDPYEQSKKRRREKGRRRTRKVVSSSNSEEERAFSVPVKEALTATRATRLKAQKRGGWRGTDGSGAGGEEPAEARQVVRGQQKGGTWRERGGWRVADRSKAGGEWQTETWRGTWREQGR